MTGLPVREKDAVTIPIEIDHRAVRCPEGVSVLRAAELNGVFIPSLCSHKDLSPFGGCRLCVVEIAGMRGYPLACSTVVAEGMKVLTDSIALHEMRREILELILSEHPSSCLVCGERKECSSVVPTIRKAGVTTGCRYCPNDAQCELQSLVERLGVTDIGFPVSYRGYEAEHDDPFFDRDYNVCILCGRCVRMCQEVRGTSVLAFEHRGPKTRIGTAFGRSHVEAGCEFCGACVSVCPTGTLADKVSKWDGPPDGFEVSTCPFCALGCQVELHHKGGRLSKALPRLDPEVNDGQLCVRGRFCLPEATHHHERSRKPLLKRDRWVREVSWTEALEDVSSHLEGLAPENFLMLVSPDLTNESLYAARRFVRESLGSGGIDSTARWALPGGARRRGGGRSHPQSIRGVGEADAIVAVGLDSRFSFSVAGVEVRRALRHGATLVTIDPRDSNLARYTRHWLRPRPGGEGAVLLSLAERLAGGAREGTVPPEAGGAAELTGVDADALEAAASALEARAESGKLAIVVGPAAFAVDTGRDLAKALLLLGGRERTTFLPLYQGSNTRGLFELGVLEELLPGGSPPAGRRASLAGMLEGRARPKVLYLVGESPFFERPECDYVIAQDTYRPPFEVDAFLPAASFAEAGGTLTNIEGRVQRLVGIETLPDGAATGLQRPDWFIFEALAEKLGRGGAPSRGAEQVLEEIAEKVAGFPATPDRRPRRLVVENPVAGEPADAAPAGAGEHRLVLEPGGFRHRGTDLSSVVEGLSELALEEGVRLHPDDLRELGVASGEPAILRVDGVEVPVRVKADPDSPRGVIYAHRPLACGGVEGRKALAPLYRLGGSLLPATIARDASSRARTASTGDSGGSGGGAGG